MEDLQAFLRQVRSRSVEHRRAMRALAKLGLPGQMVAILRQELDSLIRVIYLLTQDLDRRAQLVSASVGGKMWLKPNSRARVTDREMVDLSQELQGWTQSVYKFGCAFIHLSAFHDYSDRDPLQQISPQERQDILEHSRAYHGGPKGESFADLVPYLPKVLAKVSANLDCYLEELEANSVQPADEV